VRTPHKLALLGSLYFSQGLPFGFFTQTLPVLLRKTGMSLAMIGGTTVLAAPWMLKFLWAPAVDRYGSARWGARRGWIVPLQALSALLMLALSALDPARHLALLFAGVLLANFLAASQDIATDALAVDLLSEKERGFGNGVQVAGYRVGMIVGGGLLLVVFEQLGWARSFWLMGVLLCAASVPIWLFVEPRRALPAERPRLGLGPIWHVLSRPAMRTFIPVLVTYKSADAFGTAMLRPFLVDRGLSLTYIGWVLGTLGFAAGLAGALAGGALASRFARRPLLAVLATLHALGLGAFAVCAAGLGGEPLLLGTIVFEHFAGGMATAALFTAMMDHAEPDQAATDYTVQACLVLVAGLVLGTPSGLFAEAVGYTMHFASAMVLGCAAACLAWWVTGPSAGTGR
jgi:PAT family beta-lactamase induction signal transducer AmpG